MRRASALSSRIDGLRQRVPSKPACWGGDEIAPILSADHVVRRIAAERAYVEEADGRACFANRERALQERYSWRYHDIASGGTDHGSNGGSQPRRRCEVEAPTT